MAKNRNKKKLNSSAMEIATDSLSDAPQAMDTSELGVQDPDSDDRNLNRSQLFDMGGQNLSNFFVAAVQPEISKISLLLMHTRTIGQLPTKPALNRVHSTHISDQVTGSQGLQASITIY
ncbi:uncharacterized protein LOC21401710 isoform X1 [Morus notabilis]|uniref:uncharacterized protein LOC21401710 isoform X1 n=1 Tax=Morus notabilis TaxID=981085 RepID=UPI000CED53D8|nr:uncharacterized protein LOC21401710 isoform X1 [Morus notabilis]